MDNRLAEQVMKGNLKEDVIRKTNKKLIRDGEKVEARRDKAEEILKGMGDLDAIRKDAEERRKSMLEYFGSMARVRKMSYDEKRAILSNLFSGKDMVTGRQKRVYIDRDKDGPLSFEIEAGLYWSDPERKPKHIKSSRTVKK